MENTFNYPLPPRNLRLIDVWTSAVATSLEMLRLPRLRSPRPKLGFLTAKNAKGAEQTRAWL